MTRLPKAFAALAALALVGCKGSKYDGVYRVIYEFKDGTASWDASFPDEHVFEDLVTVYSTSQGTIVISASQALMNGTREGPSFEAMAEYGYTSDICSTYAYQQLWEVEGDFTSDLGIEATATYTERQAQAGCDGLPDADASYEIEYDISGIQLRSHSGRFPGENSNWGYVPSLGGSASISGGSDVVEE